MPLWLVPPLVLILPPLIWGWLTYRVFAFDALATHASGDERKAILREHRGSLLVMGVLSGYLGAAPSLLWASGAMFIALAALAGACGDLDLHPGVRLRFPLVRPFLPDRAAAPAGQATVQVRAAEPGPPAPLTLPAQEPGSSFNQPPTLS
jgi:hypothetical protein